MWNHHRFSSRWTSSKRMSSNERVRGSTMSMRGAFDYVRGSLAAPLSSRRESWTGAGAEAQDAGSARRGGGADALPDRAPDIIALSVIGTDEDEGFPDIPYGTDAADTFDLLGGDDVAYGNGGDDLMLLGAGDDFANAGLGADRVEAGPGSDFVRGSAGPDVLLGEDGEDLLQGESGNDQLLAATMKIFFSVGRTTTFWRAKMEMTF